MHFRNEKFMTIFQLKCYQTFQPVLKYAIMIVLSIELVHILTNIQNCFQFEKSAFLSHQSHLAIYCTRIQLYTATYGSKIKINLTRITFKLTWRLRFYMPFVKSLYGNLSLYVLDLRSLKRWIAQTLEIHRNCIWSFNWHEWSEEKPFKVALKTRFVCFFSCFNSVYSDAIKKNKLSLSCCARWDYPFLPRSQRHQDSTLIKKIVLKIKT